MFNVLVLGAGPAGLLAAHTAVQAGASVRVWSFGGTSGPVKSELHGCQYLHAPVLDGLGEGTRVDYTLSGDPIAYREKVYGENWQGQVSPDEYGPQRDHRAWDLRLAYDRLWGWWSHRITATDRMNAFAIQAFLIKSPADLIISTIPAPSLCWANTPGAETDKECVFRSQMIWAMGEASMRLPIPCPENTVVCDGTRDVGWYRKARVFGHTTVEYPWRDGKKPPLNAVAPVQKPLSTTCDCHLESGRLVRVGRFGVWRKGYLVHEVVKDVRHAVQTAMAGAL